MRSITRTIAALILALGLFTGATTTAFAATPSPTKVAPFTSSKCSVHVTACSTGSVSASSAHTVSFNVTAGPVCGLTYDVIDTPIAKSVFHGSLNAFRNHRLSNPAQRVQLMSCRRLRHLRRNVSQHQ